MFDFNRHVKSFVHIRNNDDDERVIGLTIEQKFYIVQVFGSFLGIKQLTLFKIRKSIVSYNIW
jgi:hypothetical protein